MARTERIIAAPIDVVWDALVDPHTYPRWLIGADRIRALDTDWPAVGSRFHHRVGVGPLKVDDASMILEIHRPERLVLKVRATPLIQGVVTFALDEQDGRTRVEMVEEPILRVLRTVLRPLLDPPTHARNATSLRHLADLVEPS